MRYPVSTWTFGLANMFPIAGPSGLRQDDLAVNSRVARYSFGRQLLAERTRICQSFVRRPGADSQPRKSVSFFKALIS